MLDMGFEHDIRNLVWHAFGADAKAADAGADAYRPHQTFLYSAPRHGPRWWSLAGAIAGRRGLVRLLRKA